MLTSEYRSTDLCPLTDASEFLPLKPSSPISKRLPSSRLWEHSKLVSLVCFLDLTKLPRYHRLAGNIVLFAPITDRMTGAPHRNLHIYICSTSYAATEQWERLYWCGPESRRLLPKELNINSKRNTRRPHDWRRRFRCSFSKYDVSLYYTELDMLLRSSLDAYTRRSHKIPTGVIGRSFWVFKCTETTFKLVRMCEHPKHANRTCLRWRYNLL